jgi:hypothetical protein
MLHSGELDREKDCKLKQKEAIIKQLQLELEQLRIQPKHKTLPTLMAPGKISNDGLKTIQRVGGDMAP